RSKLDSDRSSIMVFLDLGLWVYFLLFPSLQAEQRWSFYNFNLGKPLTKSFIARSLMVLKFKWFNQRCHNHNLFLEAFISIPTASDEFPLPDYFPTAGKDRFPLLSERDAPAEEVCTADEVKVIEYGDSYEAPQEVADTDSASEGSAKKNQLKQQYGNFKAEGKETLEQTFNRLQAIISHLEFMDVEIKQDDLNQKFLTSLAPEWLMYMIVWRNRTKTSSGKEEVNTASFSTVSTQVSPVSVDVATASFSHDTVCTYIASQSNGSQVKYKDINQIDEEDIEEMDIKWNMALLSMRADKF
nr:hypothetical protein [Tanacetum cinerariifolium]